MKVCPCCNVEQSRDSFYISKGNLSAYCKPCWKIKVTRKAQKPTKETRKNSTLKHRFGISLSDFNIMYEEQHGRCAICGKEITKYAESRDLTTVACVDHSHVTGRVRGLLCNHCNTGIGLLQENPVILNSAINYLLGRGDK
jgi:hypothetical protein